MTRWKARVYVAGPYTQGDTDDNVYQAIKAGDRLLELGYLPFIPHLNHFWALAFPHPYRVWANWDNEWLLLCDCVLRLPGYSPGADEEERVAGAHYKTVFYSMEELERCYGGNKAQD